MYVRFVGAFIAVVLLSHSTLADETAATMRQVVAQHGDSVVTVKMAIKETMSMEGFGSEQSEYTQEINATVISPEGLMVTSLMRVDPATMMAALFPGDEDEGFETKTEITAIRVLFGDKEVESEVVLRDRDLDLAFLRPLKKPEAPWKYSDLATSTTPATFDPIFVLSRMGQVVNRLVTANDVRIYALIEKPRKLYIIGEYPAGGTPVYTAPGACLGINVTRTLGVASNTGMGFTSGFDSNMASIVVPGADILELIDQVPPYKKKK